MEERDSEEEPAGEAVQNAENVLVLSAGRAEGAKEISTRRKKATYTL